MSFIVYKIGQRIEVVKEKREVKKKRFVFYEKGSDNSNDNYSYHNECVCCNKSYYRSI